MGWWRADTDLRSTITARSRETAVSTLLAVFLFKKIKNDLLFIYP